MVAHNMMRMIINPILTFEQAYGGKKARQRGFGPVTQGASKVPRVALYLPVVT